MGSQIAGVVAFLCSPQASCITGAIVAAVALAANSAMLAAQISVAAGPVVGYYLALGASSPSDGPNAPGSFSAPAYGGELTVWTHRRLGMQVQGAVASSHREESVNPGGWEGPLSGQITMGSLQTLYDIDANRPHRLWIGGGAGFVHHSGEAFQSSGSPTEAAAAFGVGSTRPINAALQLTWGASALVYTYTGILGIIGGLPQPNGTSALGSRVHRFRSDLLFHVSLTWNGS